MVAARRVIGKVLSTSSGARTTPSRASSFLIYGLASVHPKWRSYNNSRTWHDLLQNISDQLYHVLASGTHVPGVACGSTWWFFHTLVLHQREKILVMSMWTMLTSLSFSCVWGEMLFNRLKYSKSGGMGTRVSIFLTVQVIWRQIDRKTIMTFWKVFVHKATRTLPRKRWYRYFPCLCTQRTVTFPQQ